MPVKYYTSVKDDLIRSERLTPYEKVVVFVLLTYGDCESIFISQDRLAREANMSRDTVCRVIKTLKAKKMLKTKIKPDRSSLEYKLHTGVVTAKKRNVTAKTDKGYGLNRQGVTAKTDTSIKSISIKKLDIEVTVYLNGKAKRKFESVEKQIKPLLKKGYTVEDFKKVIDIKVAEWYGTDYAKYLRPSTLFGSKFNEYLNQPLEVRREVKEAKVDQQERFKTSLPEFTMVGKDWLAKDELFKRFKAGDKKERAYLTECIKKKRRKV